MKKTPIQEAVNRDIIIVETKNQLTEPPPMIIRNTHFESPLKSYPVTRRQRREAERKAKKKH